MNFRSPSTMAAAMALGLLAGGTASADHGVDLQGAFGYDTNPLELNDIVATREGMFLDMDAVVNAEGQATKGWLKKAEAARPWGRLLKPEEVARACAYLSSEESGLMSGSIIDFDQQVMGAGDSPAEPPAL